MAQPRSDDPFVMLQEVLRAALESPQMILIPAMTVNLLPGWHLFSNVDVLMKLEELLGVEFHYTELSRLRTVSDYLHLIDAHWRAETGDCLARS